MDPDAALAKIRELLKFVMSPPEEMKPGLTGEFVDKAVELAAFVEGLDGWMSTGGFLPEDWARAGLPRDKRSP